MSDKTPLEPFDEERESKPEAEHDHSHMHGHHYDIHAEDDSRAVERIRARHRETKSERPTEEVKPKQVPPVAKKRPGRSVGRRKRRLIFWGQITIVLFICITAALTFRAIEMATIRSGGISWFDELKQGNLIDAADKFSIVASDAVSQVFTADLSTEAIMQEFNAALPHLRKAGYVLIEMEVEVGIPPKLIPHFYHDADIKLDLDKTLAALGDNSIGRALVIALAEAGKLQKKINVADMQFDYIEVELGPIPALKLQYKNYYAVKKAINSSR